MFRVCHCIGWRYKPPTRPYERPCVAWRPFVPWRPCVRSHCVRVRSHYAKWRPPIRRSKRRCIDWHLTSSLANAAVYGRVWPSYGVWVVLGGIGWPPGDLNANANDSDSQVRMILIQLCAAQQNRDFKREIFPFGHSDYFSLCLQTATQKIYI